MFKWIKVISRLSRQDDVMAELDAKVQSILSQMEVFKTAAETLLDELKKAKADACSETERISKSSAELRKFAEDLTKHIEAKKSDLSKVSKELTDCQDTVAAKIDELQKVALAHVETVNEKVKTYGESVSELSQELMRLGDSITEFQKR